MLKLDVQPRSRALRCTYCFDSLPDEGVHACAGCGTILHGECAAELSTCPTIGCERELRVQAFDLSSLSDALDLAERALQAANRGGDFHARRRAQETYSAARRAYRQRDREQLELGFSPTQQHEPPARRPPTPSPWRTSFWDLHFGWKFYLWATAIPSLESTNYLLQQLPFRVGVWVVFASALVLSLGSLYCLKGLCLLAAPACARLWRRITQ